MLNVMIIINANVYQTILAIHTQLVDLNVQPTQSVHEQKLASINVVKIHALELVVQMLDAMLLIISQCAAVRQI